MNDAAGQRALRKQLLLMRSATERAELAQAALAARQSLAAFKSGVPGLAMGKGLPLALGLMQRAPLISSLLPLLLAGARRPLLRKALLGAGSALLLWTAYQWLAGQRGPDGELAEDRHPPAAD
ncbi:MAG: hypothetical protein Q8M51_02550 [Polaromonas sp.]|nr:hypothetical protein [Polaromonas sp.]MDP3354730.1 hypothetical protein [Polaromonas sp.]MDP3752172.1 hypothetical protein [Polaromonas sp.]